MKYMLIEKVKLMNGIRRRHIAIWMIPWLLLTSAATAQERQIRVVSETTDEPLVQAYGQNLRSLKYAVADEDGNIRINALGGDTIQVSYVGFNDTGVVILDSIIPYTVSMTPAVMEEVVIFGTQDFSRKAALGLQNVPMEFLQALPGLTGETDILKSLIFLPGVTGGREGYSHLLVRGGNQDQNLILLDGATLFNVNHAAGFISLFNTSLISHTDFYKSYWPSLYGGRLSSVLDVQMKRGNKKQREGSIDIGIVTSKIDLSGPISKDGRTSYSVGARTTLLDLIFLPKRIKISRKKIQGAVPGYTFYDLNGKIDHRFNDRETLALSFYHGSDIMSGRVYEKSGSYGSDNLNRYGLRNWITAANYSKMLNTRHSLHAHLSYSAHRNYLEDNIHRSEYDFQQQYVSTDITDQRTDNDIRSLKGRINGKYYFSGDGHLAYGMEAEQLTYGFSYRRTDGFRNNTDETSQSFGDDLKGPKLWLYSPYLDAEIGLGAAFRVKGGIRTTYLASAGRNSWQPEPKAMLIWESGPRSTFNLAYNRQHQPIHLLAYNMEGIFIENFILADRDIAPSSSHQYSAGFFRSFTRWIDNFSLEFYYKNQTNMVKYVPPGMDFPTALEYKPDLFRDGEMESYGMELMLQKTSGDFHGSLSYSRAYATSVFTELNQGKPFPTDFDARNQVNTLLIYQINDQYRLSAQWTYLSGRPVIWTNEEVPGDPVLGLISYEVFHGINNERLPAFHRLDLGLRRDRISERTGRRYWFGLNIYNAYYRKNPYTLERQGRQWKIRSIFPLIPSINLGFEL